MSAQIVAGLIYTSAIMSLVGVDVSLNLLIRPAWVQQWNFLYGPIYCTINLSMAGYQLSQGHRTGCVVYSAFALGVLLIWWNDPKNRNRRKKWLKKAKEKVVDLGGRLGVQRPAPASA
jgi:hypothetical protein